MDKYEKKKDKNYKNRYNRDNCWERENFEIIKVFVSKLLKFILFNNYTSSYYYNEMLLSK